MQRRYARIVRRLTERLNGHARDLDPAEQKYAGWQDHLETWRWQDEDSSGYKAGSGGDTAVLRLRAPHLERWNSLSEQQQRRIRTRLRRGVRVSRIAVTALEGINAALKTSELVEPINETIVEVLMRQEAFWASGGNGEWGDLAQAELRAGRWGVIEVPSFREPGRPRSLPGAPSGSLEQRLEEARENSLQLAYQVVRTIAGCEGWKGRPQRRQVQRDTKRMLREARETNVRYLHRLGYTNRSIAETVLGDGRKESTVRNILSREEPVETYELLTVAERLGDHDLRLREVERQLGLQPGGEPAVEREVERFLRWHESADPDLTP